MKNMRKLLSLVLALMLLLSLSVNAFAAENAATINITVEGEPYITQPIDSAISVKAALQSNPDWEAVFGDPFTDIYGNEAYALISLMEYGSDPADGPSSGKTAEAWSTVNPGYGLVGTGTNEAGQTTYTYIYVGYDWTYSVRNASGAEVDVSELYMNQYIIQDGDVVTVDYAFQDVTWTTTTPLRSTYPYI